MGPGPLPESGGLSPAALVCALDWEAKCVPASAGALLTAACGMGAEAAKIAARRLAGSGAAALISFGSAGALDPGLRSGDVLLPARVVDENGRLWPADRGLHRDLGERFAAYRPCTADLFAAARPLAGARDKAERWEKGGAAAVDMESAALAEVAAEFAVPFAVLRVVIDEQRQDIPEALVAACDPFGRISPARLGALLLGRRVGWRQIARLAKARRCAARRLRRLAGELAAAWESNS